MSTPGLPDYKRPPKRMQLDARAARDRLKACHGNWYPCQTAHPDAPSVLTATCG